MDKFYAVRINPDDKATIEQKEEFNTQSEAEKHIDAVGTGGQIWIILKNSNGTYDFIRGFRYQKAQ